MRASGIRRLFRPKNLAEFAQLRQRRAKQLYLAGEGLSLATISRIERGFRCIERTARAIHEKLAPEMGFEELFEVSSEKDKAIALTWEQISRAAGRVGRKVFHEFKPHMVLTFAGPSSLFTAIVMTKSLTREEFLRTTVYTAIFRDKRRQLTPSERNGFRIVDSERFLVRVPQAMTRIGDLASKRMTIIDDTVTTGSVMEHLRDYFVQRGFLRENIQCVTCVCSHQAWSDPRTRPDVWIFRPKGSYRMPWGDPL